MSSPFVRNYAKEFGTKKQAMDDDRRDPSRPGRREEDERWLKVQEQIMNLVTAERTDQQELTTMKAEVLKLTDHLDDLDDHLRGVAGRESMDSRVLLLERESAGNRLILRQIKKQLDDLTMDVSGFKIHRSIIKESEQSRLERFLAWLKFWGPIILALIALIIPLAKLTLDYKPKSSIDDAEYRPDERLRQQIELDKKSKHAKDVKKKLRALEQIQANH